MTELTVWLDSQHTQHTVLDSEVVDVHGFGKLFRADLSGVKSIFRQQGDTQVFNLMEDPQTLMDEGIFHVAFPFGRNWYYYDLREEFALNILKYIGKPQMSECAVPFVNLGVHTPFELLNASGDISTWVKKAKWLGHSAIGICDRNTMAGTLALQKECVKAGLKHVFGYSFTLDHFGEDVDMKVYCGSQTGLGNLLRIQKAIMVDREDGKIGLQELLDHAEGLVLVLGTLSAYWMVKNPKPLDDLKRAFGKVYYQFDPTEYKADRIDVKYLNNLKQFFHNFHRDGAFDIEPVLIPDCHYPDADDAQSKIILNKIASGVSHNQSEEQYFRSADELFRATKTLFDPLSWDVDALFERMCRNAVEIAEGAEAHYELGRMYMPRYDMRPDEIERYGGRREMFLSLLDEAMKTMIPEAKQARYRERLDEEIYIIESTNNVDYFLIQWDMIREARRRGIVTGIGRGSAGGSLVSYLLGITSIDPIEYDLLFSRFLVPERCGLFWKDEVTRFCNEIDIEPDSRYVEVMLDGKKLCFDTDAQLRVIRGDDEMTVYADELCPDDEVILDNCDILWNVSGIKQWKVSEVEVRTTPMGITVSDSLVGRGLRSGGHSALPDIDVDYQSDRRQEIKEYLERRYNTDGRQRVFSAGTFSTMKLKAVLKDVARVHKLPHGLVNYITAIFEEDGMGWTDLFRLAARNAKIRKFVNDHPEVIEDIRNLMGQPRSTSIHASAIIVTPSERDGRPAECFDFLPIRKMDGLLVSEFDGYSVEEIGLLKEDVLATKELSKLGATIEIVNRIYGKSYTLESITQEELRDAKTYELLSGGFTQNVFQFASRGITKFIMDVRPDCIEDLIVINALYRPATLDIGATDEFVRYKRGEVAPIYNYGTYEATKNTFGLLVYQEQFMSIAHTLGGFDLGKTDHLRKAMGKKNHELMATLKDDFIAGAIANGCPDYEAKDIWHKIELAGGYSFNRSHAAAYALTAFAGAWLKANYPSAFYTVALQWADDKEIPQLMSEMELCSAGKIVPPDINVSEVQFHTDYATDEIFWSLGRIKMVGIKTAEYIVTERERGGSFEDIDNFIRRIFRGRWSKDESGRIPVTSLHVKNLILAGCFDKVEGIEAVTDRYAILKRAAGLLKFEIGEDEFPTVMLDKHHLWSRFQVAVSGIGSIDYRRIFDGSPVREKIKGRASWMTLRDVLDMENEGKKVAVCATVTEVEELSYKDRETGDRVAFAKLTLQQNIDTMELVCWNDFYAPRRKEIAGLKDKIVVITAIIKYSDYTGSNALNTMKSSILSIE